MVNKFRVLCVIFSMMVLTGCQKEKPIYQSTISLDYYLYVSNTCGRFASSTCISLYIGHQNVYGEFDFPCNIMADEQVSTMKFGTVHDAVLTIYKNDSSEITIPEKTLNTIYGELCTEMAKHGDLTKYIKDHEL